LLRQTQTPAVDLRAETYGTLHGSPEHSNEEWLTQKPKIEPCKVFTKRVVALVIALGIFSYHSMTYDHLLPIFLEDSRADPVSSFLALKSVPLLSPSAGGLGLSLRTVGMIMSVNGLIALVVQAVIFPLAEYFGVFRLFIIVSILHPVSYFVMPYLLLPPSFLFTGIYSCLFIRNILQIVAYPLLLILIEEATPSKTVLGKINGLAASAGAASRTVAPPVAGYLYTTGSRVRSSGFAWYGSGIVAIIGALQCFMVVRAKKATCETELGESKKEGLTVTVIEAGHDCH
jgi:MFS family permease